ncbi:MAG TPA: PEP-CTERM sorting domain-containing protein [Phycisphaerae bacterium]
MKTLCALIVASVSIASPRTVETSFGDVFPVAPTASYLKTDTSDTSASPTIINLSQLSFTVTPGTTLVLQRLGAFGATNTLPGNVDNKTTLAGVFSSSNSILAPSNLNRVPGALDAGTDFVSEPTFFGPFSTDISQDFLIDSGTYNPPVPFSSVIVQVPLGAQYLIVAPTDSFYADNVDPNGDFALSVTQTPEPASLAFLGSGVIALLMRRRGRTA